MPSLETSVKCKVTVEGTTIEHNLTSVQLDQYIDDHHELVVTVRQADEGDNDPEFLDTDTTSGFLGKPISLTITPFGGGIPEDQAGSFVGIVTKVDIISSIDALNTIIIRAASPTILADATRKNRVWKDQKDSDIVSDILSSFNITKGSLESKTSEHAYIVQHNQTDYEFMLYRAALQGYFCYYDGSEMRLGLPDQSSPVTLAFRGSLGTLSIGMGVGQPEYAAAVFNYEEKKTFDQKSSAKRSSASLGEVAKVSVDASKDLFPEDAVTKIIAPVGSAGDLDKMLDRERSRAYDRMVTCEGESAVPSVKVGHCIKIEGVGKKLDGTYYVNSVTHTVDEDGYHNSFVCKPVELAAPQVTTPPDMETKLQSALVLDNDDPEKLGRVKVKLPWLPDDETPWVRVLTPHAGADHGWYVIPEIDDEVLIGYEHGDYNQPIVLGSLYNGKDTPPADGPDAKNEVKLFSTKSGAQIKITDTSGSEEISIISGDEKNQIVMESGGPSITIKSAGDITIDGKSITLKSQTTVDIDATSDTKVKGANIDMQAQAQFKAKGNAAMELQGGGMMTIKGGMVKIN